MTALQLYTRALGQNRAVIPAWVGQVQMLVELGEYHEARLWAASEGGGPADQVG